MAESKIPRTPPVLLIMPDPETDDPEITDAPEWRAAQVLELRAQLDECAFALEHLHPEDAAELARVTAPRQLARLLADLERAAALVESRLRRTR